MVYAILPQFSVHHDTSEDEGYNPEGPYYGPVSSLTESGLPSTFWTSCTI